MPPGHKVVLKLYSNHDFRFVYDTARSILRTSRLKSMVY